MSKTILTDVDETVLQCCDALQAFCDDRLGRSPRWRLRDGMAMEDAYGLTEQEAADLCLAFWHDAVFSDLAPETCAAEVLPRLHANGWRFVAITACDDHPAIVSARKTNLRTAFGFDWDVHCVGKRGDKVAHLRSYEPTIWVEDNHANACTGADIGHTAFLLRRSYNDQGHHAGVSVVTDWHDIEAHLRRVGTERGASFI